MFKSMRDPPPAQPSSLWIRTGRTALSYRRAATAEVSPADLGDVSFSDHKLVLLQLEIPIEAVLSAAQRAKESGLRVLLNPAPARPLPRN